MYVWDGDILRNVENLKQLEAVIQSNREAMLSELIAREEKLRDQLKALEKVGGHNGAFLRKQIRDAEARLAKYRQWLDAEEADPE